MRQPHRLHNSFKIKSYKHYKTPPTSIKQFIFKARNTRKLTSMATTEQQAGAMEPQSEMEGAPLLEAKI